VIIIAEVYRPIYFQLHVTLPHRLVYPSYAIHSVNGLTVSGIKHRIPTEITSHDTLEHFSTPKRNGVFRAFSVMGKKCTINQS